MTTRIDREELLSKLKVVKPVLADRDFVLQFTHFWFTGEGIMAYDDQVGIRVPCKTDFTGTVPGAALFGLLDKTTSETVELTGGDGVLSIKAGPRSKFKLPMMQPEAMLFTMPKISKGTPTLTESERNALLSSIEGCMRSMGKQSSFAPDQQGMTIVPNGKATDLFTTNATTLSTARIKVNLNCKQRVLLSDKFCSQVLEIGKDATSLQFEITDQYALMVADRVSLFGKLLLSEKPYDFPAVISQHFSDKDRKKLAPVPDDLKMALERATIIGDKARLSIEDGNLSIVSKSPLGEVTDRIKLGVSYKGIAADFSPKMLLAGVDSFDTILLTERCCVMCNDHGELYLVASGGSQ